MAQKLSPLENAERLTRLSVAWTNKGMSVAWTNKGKFFDWRQMVGVYFEIAAQGACREAGINYWPLLSRIKAEMKPS